MSYVSIHLKSNKETIGKGWVSADSPYREEPRGVGGGGTVEIDYRMDRWRKLDGIDLVSGLVSGHL